MIILYRSIMRLCALHSSLLISKECALAPARSLSGLTLCGRTGSFEGFAETFDQACLVARLLKEADGTRF